ncbi:hypothetical protein PHJA_000938300 [Phtheirospermum japonicum]|uniref:Agenet domain-containing protein n=1 Tax=Phtheirospermum japonicum TaxID=374723 RepID=A0A830BM91_9LAMI|nr:hypothetical protein PHJA_000938300 [Phtheirospermum japonicum]
MANDGVSEYFKKGANVEISSDDEGFRGSWYEGTVLRPPRTSKRGSAKVLVQYKTLTEDEAGTQPLREELEVVQLRPLPPREVHRSFKFGEEVDAYYNDGWWEGTITEVVGDDDDDDVKYLVFFSGTREQIAFDASEMRLHREWEYGKWVPPLEPSAEPMPDVPMDEESTEVKANNEEIEHSYSPGDPVEASSQEEGFEGAFFAATILKNLKNGKYVIEYQTLKDDDGTTPLREEIDNLYIRPPPPDVEIVDRFEVGEEVDALCNDGWWAGVISKVLKNDRYSVYFSASDEELKFKHTDLRVHQVWINGKWRTSKVI